MHFRRILYDTKSNFSLCQKTYLEDDIFCSILFCIYILPDLKVGSWSLECIIISLIYLINCRKALLTRKWVSFSKKCRVKSIKLAVFFKEFPNSTAHTTKRYF